MGTNESPAQAFDGQAIVRRRVVGMMLAPSVTADAPRGRRLGSSGRRGARPSTHRRRLGEASEEGVMPLDPDALVAALARFEKLLRLLQQRPCSGKLGREPLVRSWRHHRCSNDREHEA